MAKKTIAVIGLGQFGLSIVRELAESGADVIAIDRNPEIVKSVADIVPTAFVADSTDNKALQQLKIKDCATVVIAIGENAQASVITTVLLKEIGVRNIIVRADNEYFVPILKKLGADEVISPQIAAGTALAKRLGNNDFTDIYLLNDKYSVVSLHVNEKFEEKTLTQLNAKNVYGINLVLIKRGKKAFVPGGSDSLIADDMVYVVGTTKEINTFSEAINGKYK